MRKYALLFALVCGSAFGQALSYTPPAVGSYFFNGSLWTPVLSASGYQALNYIPPAYGLYCYSGTNWTPCTFSVNGTVISPTQIIGGGSTPTIAAGSAAGTGATVSISGANLAGRITVNTGTGTLASATLATVTFAGTVATAPQVCVLQPTNNFADGQVGMVYTTYPTTTGWTLAIAGTAIPVSSTYTYGFICI